MNLSEKYEEWRNERYEHLGDIGFADAIHSVMNWERWIIALRSAPPQKRVEMINEKYKVVVEMIDDYEWDATFTEDED